MISTLIQLTSIHIILLTALLLSLLGLSKILFVVAIGFASCSAVLRYLSEKWTQQITNYLNWAAHCEKCYEKQEFSDSYAELELIKSEIDSHYIKSWTPSISLSSNDENSLSSSLHQIIDDLVAYYIEERRLKPTLLIADLVSGVHNHIIKYKNAERAYDIHPRKQTVPADRLKAIEELFLGGLKKDWVNKHSEATEYDYLKAVIALVLAKEACCEITHEALTSIITMNALDNLVTFLSQQSSILMIVIIILSDNPDEILSRARIYNHDSILDDSIDTVCGIEFHDVITEDEFEEPGSKILSNTEVASIDDDKAPSPSPTDQVKFSLSDEGKSKNGLEDSSTEDPEVYIANNLNDFLNVAPPIPTTDDPQTGHHDQPTLAEVNSVPMVKMSTVAARVEDASVTKPPQHGNRIGGPQPAYESTNAGLRFVSVSIPSTETLSERHSQSKYTLYCILYQASYPHHGEQIYRNKVIYRRYREFVSLFARLEMSGFNMKKISGPKWYQQWSIKPTLADIDKRRKHLELFLQQLAECPEINLSEDFAEFMAYEGNGEIEFVKERILQTEAVNAPRAHKAVLKTMSGVFDKFADKMITSAESARVIPNVRYHNQAAGMADMVETEQLILVTDNLTSMESDLLEIHNSPSFNGHLWDDTIIPQGENKVTNVQEPPVAEDNYQAELTTLTDRILYILLELMELTGIQPNERVVSTLLFVIRTLLNRWLNSKLNIYTSPAKVQHLLCLLRTTLWPKESVPGDVFDLEKLRTEAISCILAEIPAAARTACESYIRSIAQYLICMTTREEMNRGLVISLIEQFLENSGHCIVDRDSIER